MTSKPTGIPYDSVIDACRHEMAVTAIYSVLNKHPKYALAQMNDLLADEIVAAVRRALAAPSKK
jgi:hypothetical protein